MNYRKLWEYVDNRKRWYENPNFHGLKLPFIKSQVEKGRERFNRLEDLLIKNRIRKKREKLIPELFVEDGKLYGRNLGKSGKLVYQFNAITKKWERYL